MRTGRPPLAETLVGAFGDERFTSRDLWTSQRLRADCYVELFSGWPRVPTTEWHAMARDYLARSRCVEAAPGTRGGEGWRVPPAVVARVREQVGERSRRESRELEEARATMATLTSRHAVITMDEGHGRVQVAYPEAVGAAVARCAARQRPRGFLSATGAKVSCALRDLARLAAAIPRLDAAAEREAALLLPRHEAAIAELSAIVERSAVPPLPPTGPLARGRPGLAGAKPTVAEHCNGDSF